MKKSKKLGLILLAMCVFCCSAFALPSSAFSKSYADQLRAKGFPESYISKLVALHDKYPQWEFVPLNTGLNFQSAVNAERSTHSKQLIEKTSSLSSAYYCSCSKCKKNGNYVIQEASNWVSASENAVKYYMDPRNFLSEKYIFQFESTSYNSSQTKTGVETILNGTWMHNSLMQYYTTDGVNKKYYDKSTKYSDVIMKAAKDSGMSAYYLASKIVQEVGSSKPNTGGSCGTISPFYGIYNYYNIGAYSGATEGLEWAAGFLRLNKNTTMYSSYSNGKVSGTKTSLKSGQYMVWRANCGSYYKVRLYTVSNGKYTAGKTGYVPVSSCRTTYFNYGRPWTNPYKAIYYGAKYIANGFSKTQNTGYLQKFNVAPNTTDKHSHEYMANVRAASSESVTTYNAYNAAGILKTAKTFIIPVYSNMPSSTSVNGDGSSSSTTTTKPASTKVTGLTLDSRTTTSLTYKWDKVSGATKYYIYIKNNTKGTTFSKTVTTNKATLNGLTDTNEYSVKVKAYVNGKYGEYSSYNTKHTLPGKVSGFTTKSRTTGTVTLKWNKKAGADGYYIYRYTLTDKNTRIVATIKGGSTTTKTFGSLKAGTYYYFYIAPYTVDSKTKTGSKTSLLTTSTYPNKVSVSSLKSTAKKSLTLSWKKVTCTGYQIQYSTSKTFSSNCKTVTVGGSKSSAKWSTSQSNKTYYVRVRAYKSPNGSKIYGSWSSTYSVKAK